MLMVVFNALQTQIAPSFTDCVGAGTVVDVEGSCRACSGVQVSNGLISGDINQCDAGYLCGDFSKNTNPVTCEPCLTDMTCNTWCNLETIWVGTMAQQPPVLVALPCLLPGQLLGQQIQEPPATLMNSVIRRAQSPFQVLTIMEYALVMLQSE